MIDWTTYQIAPSSFEIFVIKSHMLRGVAVKIRIPDRLGLHLAKPIKVQLTCKRAKLVVVKVLK